MQKIGRKILDVGRSNLGMQLEDVFGGHHRVADCDAARMRTISHQAAEGLGDRIVLNSGLFQGKLQ